MDEYLIKDKAGRIKELGMKGWELRWRVMNTPWWRNRCRNELEKMGMGALMREIEVIKRTGFESTAGTLPSVEVRQPAAVGEIASLEVPVTPVEDLQLQSAI